MLLFAWFRAGVSPFVSARSVLEPLKVKDDSDDQPDLLQLCRDLQVEVCQLKYDNKIYVCVNWAYYVLEHQLNVV